MRQRQTDLVLLRISMGGFLVMSGSFLLMPFEGMKSVSGLLFWIGLILGAALQMVLEVRRRAFFAAYGVNRKNMQKPRNGLLTFGSNRMAVIADTALPVSGAATVTVFIFTRGSGYFCYICLGILLTSFCFHCILNGRIFFHAKNQDRIRKVLERKKVNFRDEGERKYEEN